MTINNRTEAVPTRNLSYAKVEVHFFVVDLTFLVFLVLASFCLVLICFELSGTSRRSVVVRSRWTLALAMSMSWDSVGSLVFSAAVALFPAS